jgi:hypothetical protein
MVCERSVVADERSVVAGALDSTASEIQTEIDGKEEEDEERL